MSSRPARSLYRVFQVRRSTQWEPCLKTKTTTKHGRRGLGITPLKSRMLALYTESLSFNSQQHEEKHANRLLKTWGHMIGNVCNTHKQWLLSTVHAENVYFLNEGHILHCGIHTTWGIRWQMTKDRKANGLKARNANSYLFIHTNTHTYICGIILFCVSLSFGINCCMYEFEAI